MKKRAYLFLAALLLAMAPVRADEGMWMLPLLEKMNGKTMAEMGFTITPEQIYNVNQPSLKDAIVIFGRGCTGEIVSEDGLLFTNHHCGYDNIRELSTVEHNYLRDGYWAMNRNEELPAKGLTVTFLESMTDVTKQVEKATRKATNQTERDSLYSLFRKELLEKTLAGNPHLTAQLTSFYGGNQYYLIVYQTFKDIRFVGAPPSSIGKFGADTDNWMWPRHTGDFSVFRVYAGPDNKPADYSPENVPYHPKKHLKISLKGYEQGDPTFIMGNPGSTNRFMTSFELAQTRDFSNAIRIHARGVRQEVMMADMEADPKIMIQYASKYSGSSNGWKKWIGMNETFAKLDVENRRAQEEAEFTQWMNGNAKRVEKYGQALEKIQTALAAQNEVIVPYLYLSETLNKIEISSIAGQMADLMDRFLAETDAARKEQLQARMTRTMDQFYTDYNAPTDRKVSQALIELYRSVVPADFHPAYFQTLNSAFAANAGAFLDDVFAQSAFACPERIREKMEQSWDQNENLLKADVAVQMAQDHRKVFQPLAQAYREPMELLNQGKKEYIAGTLEMRKDQPIYPDANFTMRLTYGTVQPYSPRDAVYYDYYTTSRGILEKEDPNNWEFEVPAKLKKLILNKDFGPYALPNGELPVAFLSTNDITGGNSGSPILNGNGELLGLAFDGNWEAMSGDIIFEPNLQRTINVDIRYVLFIIDKFGGAGYLLDEMNFITE